MNDYDYCSKCNGIFDYLDLRPFEMKWVCKSCYKVLTRREELTVTVRKKA